MIPPTVESPQAPVQHPLEWAPTIGPDSGSQGGPRGTPPTVEPAQAPVQPMMSWVPPLGPNYNSNRSSNVNMGAQFWMGPNFVERWLFWVLMWMMGMRGVQLREREIVVQWSIWVCTWLIWVIDMSERLLITGVRPGATPVDEEGLIENNFEVMNGKARLSFSLSSPSQVEGNLALLVMEVDCPENEPRFPTGTTPREPMVDGRSLEESLRSRVPLKGPVLDGNFLEKGLGEKSLLKGPILDEISLEKGLRTKSPFKGPILNGHFLVESLGVKSSLKGPNMTRYVVWWLIWILVWLMGIEGFISIDGINEMEPTLAHVVKIISVEELSEWDHGKLRGQERSATHSGYPPGGTPPATVISAVPRVKIKLGDHCGRACRSFCKGRPLSDFSVGEGAQSKVSIGDTPLDCIVLRPIKMPVDDVRHRWHSLGLQQSETEFVCPLVSRSAQSRVRIGRTPQSAAVLGQWYGFFFPFFPACRIVCAECGNFSGQSRSLSTAFDTGFTPLSSIISQQCLHFFGQFVCQSTAFDTGGTFWSSADLASLGAASTVFDLEAPLWPTAAHMVCGDFYGQTESQSTAFDIGPWPANQRNFARCVDFLVHGVAPSRDYVGGIPPQFATTTCKNLDFFLLQAWVSVDGVRHQRHPLGLQQFCAKEYVDGVRHSYHFLGQQHLSDVYGFFHTAVCWHLGGHFWCC